MADTPLDRVIPNPQSAHSRVGQGRDGEGEWIDKINCGNKFLAENSPQLYIFRPESARKWDPLCCLSPSSPNSSMSFGVSLFVWGGNGKPLKPSISSISLPRHGQIHGLVYSQASVWGLGAFQKGAIIESWNDLGWKGP